MIKNFYQFQIIIIDDPDSNYIDNLILDVDLFLYKNYIGEVYYLGNYGPKGNFFVNENIYISEFDLFKKLEKGELLSTKNLLFKDVVELKKRIHITNFDKKDYYGNLTKCKFLGFPYKIMDDRIELDIWD